MHGPSCPTDIFIEQLTSERITTITHNIITSVWNGNIHKWSWPPMTLTNIMSPFLLLCLSSTFWPMPNLMRTIILPHQTILSGDMESQANYIGIVQRLVQRPKALNHKRANVGNETIKAPIWVLLWIIDWTKTSLSWCMKVSGMPWFFNDLGELVLIPLGRSLYFQKHSRCNLKG